MILPTIHNNGTSAQALTDSYADARVALEKAISQIAKIEMNGRDYYPQGANAWKDAVAERDLLFSKLNEVSAALYAHEEHCANFIK